MKKSGVFKEVIRFIIFLMVATFVQEIGVSLGIEKFNHRHLHDGFSLPAFFLDLIKFTIAYSIVHIPNYLKKEKEKGNDFSFLRRDSK
ncbi:hypothetical protein PRVXH_000438 [Proteinivorax hydrogeniformans]|uniref:Uncharacterized protein n=1 Tax=Proteinivorax hydrogeniformans TaxID=1826727 RepID=A0AAU8HUS0_9FIRM